MTILTNSEKPFIGDIIGNGWIINYFVCLLCLNEVPLNRVSIMHKHMRKTHLLNAIYFV